ncbi:hypothetical protein HGRIS_011990 [Hohenbuehelia grisea]|uniref:Uncharacterized protein n=1 Tax=Hohenbuehelia grisea TaxID=104357 RepID=A0ABR3JXW1_9AGAR
MLDVVFFMVYLYHIIVNLIGDRDYIPSANWLFATSPAIMGITTCIVQLFFAWRILIMAKNVWIVFVISFFSIASALGALGSAAATHFVPQFDDFPKFKVVVIIWGGALL